MRTLVLGLALVCLQISASAAGELTGTLKRIDDTGRMNLGFRESEPPMSFRDQSGNPIGYSIDLCDHIIAAVKQRLGRSDITVNYVPVTAESRFASIESAGIDILCGATTKTLGRSERVGFTQLTFVTGASLLSMNDDKVPNVLGLKGKRVAVVSNTTTIEALKGVLNEMLIDAEVVRSFSSVRYSHGTARRSIFCPKRYSPSSLLLWRYCVVMWISSSSQTERYHSLTAAARLQRSIKSGLGALLRNHLLSLRLFIN
jgi:ABC-type amino acid transport substrate-binding protein